MPGRMAKAIGPAMRRMAKAIDASIMEIHWDKRNWCFTIITDMSNCFPTLKMP